MKEYTDMQKAVIRGYVMNIGTDVEAEVNDNCNPIDVKDVARLLGVPRSVATGVMVSLMNEDVLECSVTQGMNRRTGRIIDIPMYMFTEFGVREWYRLKEEGCVMRKIVQATPYGAGAPSEVEE
jgi:hypothetical protein